MLTFYLLTIPILFAFLLFLASVFIKAKALIKICRIISLILFVFSLLVWVNSFNEKKNYGRIKAQQILVSSLTYHVEELLKNGDHKRAEFILNRFNLNYRNYIQNDEEFKYFLQKHDIPLLFNTTEKQKSLKLQN